MAELSNFHITVGVSLIEKMRCLGFSQWGVKKKKERNPKELFFFTMELFRNPARLPRGCSWRSICRRVSILLLIGAQLFTAVLFQSSIVLRCRGGPLRMVTSSRMILGNSFVLLQLSRGSKSACFLPPLYRVSIPGGT